MWIGDFEGFCIAICNFTRWSKHGGLENIKHCGLIFFFMILWFNFFFHDTMISVRHEFALHISLSQRLMKIQMRLFPTLGLHTVQAVCYLYIDLNQFAIFLTTYDIVSFKIWWWHRTLFKCFFRRSILFYTTTTRKKQYWLLKMCFGLYCICCIDLKEREKNKHKIWNKGEKRARQVIRNESWLIWTCIIHMSTSAQ